MEAGGGAGPAVTMATLKLVAKGGRGYQQRKEGRPAC